MEKKLILVNVANLNYGGFSQKFKDALGELVANNIEPAIRRASQVFGQNLLLEESYYKEFLHLINTEIKDRYSEISESQLLEANSAYEERFNELKSTLELLNQIIPDISLTGSAPAVMSFTQLIDRLHRLANPTPQGEEK